MGHKSMSIKQAVNILDELDCIFDCIYLYENKNTKTESVPDSIVGTYNIQDHNHANFVRIKFYSKQRRRWILGTLTGMVKDRLGEYYGFSNQ